MPGTIPCQPVEAPSVAAPESIIPSADASPKLGCVAFQILVRHAVPLPESFRGGCSFGAGAKPVSPDVTSFKYSKENTGFETLSTQRRCFQPLLREFSKGKVIRPFLGPFRQLVIDVALSGQRHPPRLKAVLDPVEWI